MALPLVSVCIVTYNHELYIERCLRSILAQKLMVKIEIIVGDDASSDRTPEIISMLHKEYPDVVCPVLRSSNIGPHRNFIDIFQRAKGDFIAYCEGDDYWLDENKLQIQMDALLRYPEIDMCFHPAKEYRDGKFYCVINNYGPVSKVLGLRDVILGGGGYMPSASWFMRAQSIIPFPGWFIDPVPVGDNFIQILGARRGGALYLPEPLVAYNRFNPGSITYRNKSRPWSVEKVNSSLEGYKRCYESLIREMPEHKHFLQHSLSGYVFASLTHLLILGEMKEYHRLLKVYAKELAFLSGLRAILLDRSKSNFGFYTCCALLRLKRWIA